MAEVREFETGATRDTEEGKLDYEAFLSPLVMECYAEFMHKHRHQSDGELRPGDNWQKGIPLDAYMKSGWRHHMDWWKEHRGITTQDGVKAALCAVIFNASGYLHELLKKEASLESLSDGPTACAVEPRSLRSDIGESAPCTIRHGLKELACDLDQAHELKRILQETSYSTSAIPHGMV